MCLLKQVLGDAEHNDIWRHPTYSSNQGPRDLARQLLQVKGAHSRWNHLLGRLLPEFLRHPGTLQSSLSVIVLPLVLFLSYLTVREGGVIENSKDSFPKSEVWVLWNVNKYKWGDVIWHGREVTVKAIETKQNLHQVCSYANTGKRRK